VFPTRVAGTALGGKAGRSGADDDNVAVNIHRLSTFMKDFKVAR
jgi:hypothetical protein